MVGTNEDERFTEETAGFANEEVPVMEFRNDCDVYRDRSVRASWKVPAFCCNDWGALKLFGDMLGFWLRATFLISCTGLPIVLGLVGALRQ